jgi:uncharacterized protein (DUF427 family)
VKAIWNDKILAESDDTVMVEGNHYFPREAINNEFFLDSSSHTVCPWKGKASYYDVVVDGEINRNAAWYYPSASQAAKRIEGYIAFWHGVRVTP